MPYWCVPANTFGTFSYLPRSPAAPARPRRQSDRCQARPPGVPSVPAAPTSVSAGKLRREGDESWAIAVIRPVVALGVGVQSSSSKSGKHPPFRVIRQYLFVDDVPNGGISPWRVTLPIHYVGACREPRHPDAALITGRVADRPPQVTGLLMQLSPITADMSARLGSRVVVRFLSQSLLI